MRLTSLGIELGCVGQERAHHFAEFKHQIAMAETHGRTVSVDPQGRVRTLLERLDEPAAPTWLQAFPPRVGRHLRTETRYHGYLQRQAREIAQFRSDASVSFPDDLNYRHIGGLSTEARERFEAARPSDFAQAQQVRGITPAALLAVLAHVRRIRNAA